MGVRRALASTLLAGLALAVLVYGLLFQFYSTDDDVAIRLILEGRMFPHSAPSGHAIFINLALGQALAALYRAAPGIDWYDCFEQGLLWLSLLTILYAVCRGMRTWAGAGVLACALLICGCMLVEIQFTTVAMAAAFAGCLAIAGPAPGDRTATERWVLSGLGVLMLVAGAALRQEAAALMIASLALGAAIFRLSRRAAPSLAEAVRSGVPFGIAAAVVGGMVVYHLRTYASDPVWWPFLSAHALRGAIVEYAPVRADPAAIGAALKAAGWTALDYDLLKRWTLLEPSLYTPAHMRAFLAALPPLRTQLAWTSTLREMALYPVRYWYIGAAVLALAAARLNRRNTVLFIAMNLGFVVLVLASSILLKALPHRVIWPLLAAHLAMLSIGLTPPRQTAPRRLATVLLVVSVAGFIVHGVGMSWVARAAQPQTLAFVAHLANTPARPVVTIAGGFPFQQAERPFKSGVVQRRALFNPIGPYSASPLRGSSPTSGLAAMLCDGPTPEIVMDPTTPALLARFYGEERGRTVAFEPAFKSGRIQAYRCRELSPAAGTAG